MASGKRIETRIGGLPSVGTVVYQVSYTVRADGTHEFEVLQTARATNPDRLLTEDERTLLKRQENLY